MSPRRRQLIYISCMPLLVIVDIMIAFAGINLNILLYIMVIAVALVRLSEKGVISESIKDWTKYRFELFFDDMDKTGVMPTGRFLRIVVPILISIVLNQWIIAYIH